MRTKKGSKIHLANDTIKCLNCGKISLKYPRKQYAEPRKYCCHPCAIKHHKKIRPIGERHYLWGGINAHYTAKHDWIRRHYGHASKCEHCGIKNSKYQWANKDGKYRRGVSDYIQLCRSCHGKYDHLRLYGDKCRRGHKRPPENERKKKYGKWKECVFCRREKAARDKLNAR